MKDLKTLVCSVQSLQFCLTLCNPMDCRPPGSSAHGILQARILEWDAMPFLREWSQPGYWIRVSVSPAFQADSSPTETLGRLLVCKDIYIYVYIYIWASYLVLMVTNSPASAGDLRGAVGSLGCKDPLEKEMATHSSICLENPMDRGTWWATVHGVAKSQTWLKRLSTQHTCTYIWTS